MATLVINGLTLIQHENYTVSASRNGRPIVKFDFSRELTGKELSDLAFWVNNR